MTKHATTKTKSATTKTVELADALDTESRQRTVADVRIKLIQLGHEIKIAARAIDPLAYTHDLDKDTALALYEVLEPMTNRLYELADEVEGAATADAAVVAS